MTVILRLTNSPDADEPVLRRAAELLRRGGLVAFPTETVYGLGANALDATAIKRIFEAKGRPANNPIIVHVDSTASAKLVADSWPDTAEKLARNFWPGPLTLVLPKKESVPDIVTAGAPNVAIRMPGHAIALRLLQLAGIPIAAPSANRSSQLSPTNAEHVAEGLAGRIDMILDGGSTQVGLESTVLSLVESPPRLLRPGHISPAQIEALIGHVERAAPRLVDPLAPLPSPGLLERHYAPRTPLQVVEGSGQIEVERLVLAGKSVGWLTMAQSGLIASDQLRVALMSTDPQAYGSQLYAILHIFDRSKLDCIVVDLPPATDEWLAVRDRLLRAAR